MSYTLITIVLFILIIIAIHRKRRLNSTNKFNLSKNNKKVLIVGAGSAGRMVIKELYDNPQLNRIPVAIVDDDNNKLGSNINGVPIVGVCSSIKNIVDQYKIDEIIFSIAKISNTEKSRIIEYCRECKCSLKTVPGIYEIIDGKVNIERIRNVEIDDLLGRKVIECNDDIYELSKYIENKRILVTGGGGSIGSELCRQIAKYNPQSIVLLDIYENNAYNIQQELIRKYGEKLNLEVVIGSVRDEDRIDEVINRYRPNIVFHAAAHKHVPLMEASPKEAIKNNIFGTLNVSNKSIKYNVDKFVLISSDKAVNPTNIMGATKRCCEMIVQTLNKTSRTEFVAVRFGNVLGSNGSVIPLFKKQIEEGGPISVTHPDITRFFMTIPEAVSLVMQACLIAKGGEIFVLDMGEPVKILDLAKNLVRLSGLEPDVDIKFKFTGLRAGEKLFEELLMEEEGLSATKNNKIFIGNPIKLDEDDFIYNIEQLREALKTDNMELINEIMMTLVPTYNPCNIITSEVAISN